jgi:hypothetical protein
LSAIPARVFSGRRWWDGILCRAVALAVLVAAAVVVLPAQPAQALVAANTVAGWNMQGAFSGGGSNWADQVHPLSIRFPVLALQETGARPASATATGRVLPGTATVTSGGTVFTIVEYAWNRRYIYYVQTGPNPGSRTNMAIVTQQQALSVFMIPPQGVAGAGRPSFGVQVADPPGGGGGTSVFWNVHAQSFGSTGAMNNDAATIATVINTVMATAGVASWAAVGDFNRDPTTQLAPGLPPGLGLRVVSTGEATHFGTTSSELDSMVTNDMTVGLSAIRAGGPLSDHGPIAFGMNLQAAAEASGHLTSASDPDACVDVVADESANGTALRMGDCADIVDQNWTVNGDGTIRHEGKCLDDYGGNGADGTPVVLWDCHDAPWQKWQIRPDGTLRNLANDSCLSGNNGSALQMTTECGAAHADTRWSLPVPSGPIRKGIESGQCLDREGGTDNGVQPTTRSCKTGSDKSQIWSFERDGSVRSGGKCLDNYGANTADGNEIVLWDCHGGSNQIWLPIDGVLYNPASDKCAESHESDDSTLWLMTCDVSAMSQKWLASVVHGRMRIAEQTSTCFLADGADASNGTRAHLTACQPQSPSFEAEPELDWTYAADGSIRQGRKCLDGTTPEIIWWDCADARWQKWDLLADGTIANRDNNMCLDTDKDELRLSDCSASKRWIMAGESAIAPATPTVAGTPGEEEFLVNGLWNDHMLCASPLDDSVHLRKETDETDPYCVWVAYSERGRFALYNPMKKKVITYSGGNQQELVMHSYDSSKPDLQYFSWGGTESWGAQALESALDYGQNVDAKSPDSDNPTTGPVRTRGWGTGHQRELTWDTRAVVHSTAWGRNNRRMLLRNGQWEEKVLCASPRDDSVWLGTIYEVYVGSTPEPDPYCAWIEYGRDDRSILYNPEKGEVITYSGGNQQELVMRPYDPSGPDREYFTWGGPEYWGAQALRSGLDGGQNVDAKSPDSDHPTTGPVRTRGWREGHQFELTWSLHGWTGSH